MPGAPNSLTRLPKPTPEACSRSPSAWGLTPPPGSAPDFPGGTALARFPPLQLPPYPGPSALSPPWISPQRPHTRPTLSLLTLHLLPGPTMGHNSHLPLEAGPRAASFPTGAPVPAMAITVQWQPDMASSNPLEYPAPCNH